MLTADEWREVALLPEAVAVALPERAEAAHVEIRGEAGRGKSTSLIAAAASLERAGRRVAEEYLPTGARNYRTALSSSLDVFCLDEAQRLSGRERGRLLAEASRHGVRLLLGTHESFAPLFARRKMPLRVVWLDALDEAHFRAALVRRLEWAALPDVEHATLGEDALEALRARFGTDLRAAERFLYAAFQASVRQPITMSAVDLGLV